VFVPMLGVLAADFFLGRRTRGGWDVSRTASSRWGMIAAWAAGFVVYQLINPGTVGRWAGVWRDVQEALHFTPQSWMSASLLSFLVAGIAALLIGRLTKR
jgi:purine-cytosine permease-like protein